MTTQLQLINIFIIVIIWLNMWLRLRRQEMVTEFVCLCKLFGRPEGYVRIKSTIILRKELAGTGRIASNVVCLL